MRPLLVINNEGSAFPSAKYCQVQLQNSRSVSVSILQTSVLVSQGSITETPLQKHDVPNFPLKINVLVIKGRLKKRDVTCTSVHMHLDNSVKKLSIGLYLGQQLAEVCGLSWQLVWSQQFGRRGNGLIWTCILELPVRISAGTPTILSNSCGLSVRSGKCLNSTSYTQRSLLQILF